MATIEALVAVNDEAGVPSEAERNAHGAKAALTWLANVERHCSDVAKARCLRRATCLRR